MVFLVLLTGNPNGYGDRCEVFRNRVWGGSKTANLCWLRTDTRSGERMQESVLWRSRKWWTVTQVATLAKPSTTRGGCARWQSSKWYPTAGLWRRNGGFKGEYYAIRSINYHSIFLSPKPWGFILWCSWRIDSSYIGIKFDSCATDRYFKSDTLVLHILKPYQCVFLWEH